MNKKLIEIHYWINGFLDNKPVEKLNGNELADELRSYGVRKSHRAIGKNFATHRNILRELRDRDKDSKYFFRGNKIKLCLLF